ncbi:transporter [Lysobacter yananisis]|uniref:Transporter n=1 Tax=Lysobacter yananisis TaxID=1003114 RepID=A0ABY9P5I9_9GAMM|nr:MULTISPECIES: transporter [Lysobacter]UZW58585.1 transporter [Lysobacter enzymogenes]WMT02297.1 transporter [Lysobacter yananisis]
MRIADASYGSNEDGLIWGYRFVPGQPAQPISTDAVAAFLAAPADGDGRGFLWLHFSLSNTGSERYLRRALRMPDAFYDSLRSEVGSTRLELDDNALIAVIHDVLFDSSFDASEVGTTSLCIGPRLLVSARLRPLRSVDQLRAAVRSGQVFRSPVELLAHLLRDQASVLGEILRKCTVQVDRIEDRLLDNRIATDRKQLGALRRSLVRLQRLLAPEPTALFRLLNRPPDWIGRDDIGDLQQAAEEFSTAIGDSAALVERVKLIQEELAALVNEQTGRTLFVLTVVTVVALPINLVAGLFGMNVGGIPLAENPHGFLSVVIGLCVLTAVLAYAAFGRRRD